MRWLDSISRFREATLEILWAQGSGLGLPGAVPPMKACVADPEALLIAAVDLGRYDPRLFDAVAAWAGGNPHLLDTRRLKLLADRRPDAVRDALAALALRWVAAGKSPKWSALTAAGRKKGKPAPFLRRRDGTPQPSFGETDPVFRRLGMLRPPLEVRPAAAAPLAPGWLPLRVRMRCVMGVNVRAEICSVLLAVRKVHPARVACWIGAASRTVSETMREMASSGVLLGATRGRLVEYALRDREHWAAIAKVEGELPPWIDWPPLLFAACDLARVLEEPRFADASPGLQASLVADAWSALSGPFRDVGWGDDRKATRSPLLEPGNLDEIAGIVAARAL